MITKAASMRVRSRASDAECPEALPVYSVLHALALARSSSLTSDSLDSGRRRSPDLPKCESGLRFVDREKGF